MSSALTYLGLFQSRLFKVALNSLGAGFVDMVLSLAGSVLILRLLGPEIFGGYQFILATLTVVAMTTNSLDQVLLRFVAGQPVKQQGRITGLVALGKTALIIAGSAILGMVWLFWLRETAPWRAFAELPLYWFLLVSAFWQICQIGAMGLVRSTLQALGQYELVMRVLIWTAVVEFVAIAVIFFLLRPAVESGVSWIFGVKIICGTVSLLYLGARLLDHREEFRCALCTALGSPIVTGRAVFTKELRNFILPLQSLEVLTFLKHNFPSIATGVIGSLNDVATLRIAFQIFDGIHKFVPKSINFVMPSLSAVWDRGREHFDKKFSPYVAPYLLFVTCCSAVILFGGKPIFGLWGIAYGNDVQWLTVLLGLDLIAACAMQIELQYVMMSKDTRLLLISAPLRQFVQIGVTIFSIKSLGFPGVGIGRLVGTIILAASLCVGTKITNTRSWRDSFSTMRTAILQMAALSLLWLLLGEGVQGLFN